MFSAYFVAGLFMKRFRGISFKLLCTTGCIPNSLGRLVNLALLNLGGNQLTGRTMVSFTSVLLLGFSQLDCHIVDMLATSPHVFRRALFMYVHLMYCYYDGRNNCVLVLFRRDSI